MKQPNHGGQRPNAGRKPCYNEPTTTISFRVPLSLVEPITKYVQAKCKSLRIKK